MLTVWMFTFVAASRGSLYDSIAFLFLATSGAKSDVIFLLGGPDFLRRCRNFAPISLSFRDLTPDRQTDDRRQTRRPFHKVLRITVCGASIITRRSYYARIGACPQLSARTLDLCRVSHAIFLQTRQRHADAETRSHHTTRGILPTAAAWQTC